MDEFLGWAGSRKQRTPAAQVPPPAMDGEATYGYFPSSRDIRIAMRQQREKRGEFEAINKIWRATPCVPAQTNAAVAGSPSTTSRHMKTTGHVTSDKEDLTRIERAAEKYPVVNLGTYFRHTSDRRQRHFFVNPEWQSEGISVRRLHTANKVNPLTYGWM